MFCSLEHGGRECFGSSCYYFSSTQLTHTKTDADQFCADLGGYVLAPETQQETDYIKQVLALTRKSTILSVCKIFYGSIHYKLNNMNPDLMKEQKQLLLVRISDSHLTLHII